MQEKRKKKEEDNMFCRTPPSKRSLIPTPEVGKIADGLVADVDPEAETCANDVGKKRSASGLGNLAEKAFGKRQLSSKKKSVSSNDEGNEGDAFTFRAQQDTVEPSDREASSSGDSEPED